MQIRITNHKSILSTPTKIDAYLLRAFVGNRVPKVDGAVELIPKGFWNALNIGWIISNRGTCDKQ